MKKTGQAKNLKSNQKMRAFIKSLPLSPGVYQMLNAKDEIIYVGKAKSLQKRVASYFNSVVFSIKTKALIEHVAKIEFTVTADENEALLLESNLIKRFHPKYNILFKDDKSYPYLVLTKDEFPRLYVYRGAKIKNQYYFGPYPQIKPVYETLEVLQKIFLLRNCKGSFFKNRGRPCLQFQIGRCSAPCCNKITESFYRENVNLAKELLLGKSDRVLKMLKKKIEVSAKNKEYELAARYRDQIANIEVLQKKQKVTKSSGDVDVISVNERYKIFNLHILFVRSGKVIGSKTYYPSVPSFMSCGEVLEAFLEQNYLDMLDNENSPKFLITNFRIKNFQRVQKFLQQNLGKDFSLKKENKNQKYTELLSLAGQNSLANIEQKYQLENSYLDKINALGNLFNLKEPIKKIVSFDVSHTSGKNTVAALVVFTPKGPMRQSYRIYNVFPDNKGSGDDYQAMCEVLSRYFSELKKHPEKCPNIILIDGGRGHLSQAISLLNDELKIKIVAIAKDTRKKSSHDKIYALYDNRIKELNCDEIVRNFFQEIRDETHRFAIKKHRNRRGKVFLSFGNSFE